MGCGGSSFPEEKSGFLNANFDVQYEQYLDREVMNQDGVVKFRIKRDPHMQTDPMKVVTEDGKELLTVKNTAGRMYVCKDSIPIAVLLVNVRGSEVNAVDCTCNHPHVYVYAFKPYKEGQQKLESTEDGRPLYIWARVDKTSKLSAPAFRTHMAEVKGSGNDIVEMFGEPKFCSNMLQDGRMVTRFPNGKGVCLADIQGEDYALSVAPGADPALMICQIAGATILSRQM
mmetsp:Transcript_1230/g.3482  ORF Transcript_1230/g.3482 Transcript_1230/m.3482 type:complete len:229 (-) Transcript_1230:171-857(-)